MSETTPQHPALPEATIPALVAIEWKQGMAIPPDTLVIHNGLTYFNTQQGAANFEDPAESNGYSKALKGANLIKYLVNYYSSKAGA